MTGTADANVEELRSQALAASVQGNLKHALALYEEAALRGHAESMVDAAKTAGTLGLVSQRTFWMDVAASVGHEPAGSPASAYSSSFNTPGGRTPAGGGGATGTGGPDLFSVAEALSRFHAQLPSVPDGSVVSAGEVLRGFVTEPVALVSVFRRYSDTGRPPDGGRRAAVGVLAAATPSGVAWATRAMREGDSPRVGIDRYDGFEMVTFHMAEVLLEGGTAEDISFGTEQAVTTAEGEYMRALIFVQACAHLGFSGAAKATSVMPPTSEDVAAARRALGLR